MAVVVEYKPTTGDLLRAGYVGIRTRPLVFALSLGFFVLIPWLSALCASVVYFFGAPISPFTIVSLVAIPPVAIVAFALTMLFQVRGARSLQGTHIYEFSDAEIHLKGPGFDNRMDWASLTRCHGSTHGLLFMSGNAPVISVPQRSLSFASRKGLFHMLTAKGVKLSGQWNVDAEQNAPPAAHKDARR
jgi:hypothetical protein